MKTSLVLCNAQRVKTVVHQGTHPAQTHTHARTVLAIGWVGVRHTEGLAEHSVLAQKRNWGRKEEAVVCSTDCPQQAEENDVLQPKPTNVLLLSSASQVLWGRAVHPEHPVSQSCQNCHGNCTRVLYQPRARDRSVRGPLSSGGAYRFLVGLGRKLHYLIHTSTYTEAQQRG